MKLGNFKYQIGNLKFELVIIKILVDLYVNLIVIGVSEVGKRLGQVEESVCILHHMR